MPSADEECDGRQFNRAAVLAQDVCANVSNQVIDTIEGLTERNGQRLCGTNTNHECSCQTGAGRDRDRVEVLQSNVRFRHGGVQSSTQCFEMSARRDFGDNPTENRMLIHAGRYDIG